MRLVIHRKPPLLTEQIPLNPFDPPNAADGYEQTAKLSGWWIAIAYSMPLLIVLTFMNEAGWYGTGSLGPLQGLMRIVAFLVGIGSAYYVLTFGKLKQKLAAAPAALGYTALVLGILWDMLL